jgi:hypothetical protein
MHFCIFRRPDREEWTRYNYKNINMLIRALYSPSNINELNFHIDKYILQIFRIILTDIRAAIYFGIWKNILIYGIE